MRRTILVGVFALSSLALLVSSTPARALIAIGPGMGNPGLARGPQADAVVVGRVVALEDKDVKIQNVTYRIAVVQVAEAIKGTNEKMVKVGFIPMQNPVNPGGGIKIRPFPGRFGNPQLTVGQDGLFFLAKGPEGKFFTIPQNWAFVAGDVANFKSEVDTAKVAIKVGANPTAALKSKDASERLMGATLLIEKYRAQRINGKQELIDAAESKLILKALASADWANQAYGQTHPWNLFNRLGITAQDGWTPPQGARDIKEITKAAQQWVEKNSETYVIKKMVGGQPVGPGIQPPIRIQPGVIQPGIKIQIQIQPLPAIPVPQPLPIQPGQAIPIQPGRIQIQPVPVPLPPQQIEID